jgi:hypothetical protein
MKEDIIEKAIHAYKEKVRSLEARNLTLTNEVKVLKDQLEGIPVPDRDIRLHYRVIATERGVCSACGQKEDCVKIRIRSPQQYKQELYIGHRCLIDQLAKRTTGTMTVTEEPAINEAVEAGDPFVKDEFINSEFREVNNG